jgi:hypothetical protein
MSVRSGKICPVYTNICKAGTDPSSHVKCEELDFRPKNLFQGERSS